MLEYFCEFPLRVSREGYEVKNLTSESITLESQEARTQTQKVIDFRIRSFNNLTYDAQIYRTS